MHLVTFSIPEGCWLSKDLFSLVLFLTHTDLTSLPLSPGAGSVPGAGRAVIAPASALLSTPLLFRSSWALEPSTRLLFQPVGLDWTVK